MSIYQDPTEYDQISTLPNGLRVATEALPGPFSGIGAYIDAGSRYENEELCGVSHIVDRLAFKVYSLALLRSWALLTSILSLLGQSRLMRCSSLWTVWAAIFSVLHLGSL